MASRTKERITRRRPVLDEDLILSWADEHFRRTGRWPGSRSVVVQAVPTERWSSVCCALSLGRRGLPDGSSLSRILPQCGGRNATRGRLGVATVAEWLRRHAERHVPFPSVRCHRGRSRRDLGDRGGRPGQGLPRTAGRLVAGNAQGEPDRGRKAAGPKYTELC